MDRRAFWMGMVAMTIGAVLPPDAEITPRLLIRIRTANDHYRSRRRWLGARQVGSLDKHARRVGVLLRNAPRSPLTPWLAELAGEAAMLAGWSAFVDGDLRRAAEHFSAIIAAGHRSGDSDLTAEGVTRLSRISIERGDGLGALTVLDQADRQRLSPTMRVALSAHEAAACAAKPRPDAYATLALLDRADSEADKAISDPPTWIGIRGPGARTAHGSVEAYRGHLLVKVGMPRYATPVLNDVLERLPAEQFKTRGEAYLDLADALVAQDELHEGARVLGHAAHIIRRAGARRLDARMRLVRRQLNPITGSPDLATLDDLLARRPAAEPDTTVG